MSEKQTFGVLIRALGVLVFLDGSREFYFAFADWALVQRLPLQLAAPSLVYGLVTIVLGSTMIRWPEWLIRLAWLEKPPSSKLTE